MAFFFQQLMPALIRGLGVSIELIVPSAIIGISIGIFIGILRVYGHPVLKWFAGAYVQIFRGFPLIVQLYIWYFGLPLLGIFLSPFVAAVTGFSLCSGAYHAEYLRGAFQSIKNGQMQAARALGFTRVRAIFSIILPQAFRYALPSCGNEFIYLIKYSSLAYMVTCLELTGEGDVIASLTFRYTGVFITVGALYLLMVSVATLILSRIEGHFSIPGFAHLRANE
jgi:polar amino acid transport system permease protein